MTAGGDTGGGDPTDSDEAPAAGAASDGAPRFLTPDDWAVPWVTAERMREVDRVAVEEVGVSILMMMEHAGRALADPLRGTDRAVTVVAGGGGNGGGGLCAARHLLNSGVDVRVVLDRPADDLTGPAATQFGVLREMGVEPADGGTAEEAAIDRADLVLDAVIGYSLRGAPRGRARDLVERVADASAEVRSLDVPSGLDATTGERPGVAVDPDLTTTLALPKPGLAAAGGDLLLADIGLPATVFERAGVDYVWPYGDGVTVPLRVA